MQKRSQFLGPRLRRLRRDLGLTQAAMAEDLGVSASYVALIERNQRPLTAELLLRLAQTYQVDLGAFAGDGGAGQAARLEEVLRDPIFSDLDLQPGEPADVAGNSPAVTEAVLRLYTAYRESQLALADRQEAGSESDPLEALRAFLGARHNHFPVLDEQAEKLAARVEAAGGFAAYLKDRHGLALRRMPPDVMNGAVRRYDLHRRALLLDDTLDGAGRSFQIALQLAYLELGDALGAAVAEGRFEGEQAQRLARRAVANYAAGAILLPYGAFHSEAEARGYDVEALGRRFGTSFEQTAHRLTTLQKPGRAGVPFFFIRVDRAGNVSKRLDGGAFPFARHGGSCPLWSLHHVFERPREVVTETVELPTGERFFSVARTVTAGGGAHGAQRVVRAVALGCEAEHAHRLIYAKGQRIEEGPATPIGVACRLCHRTNCLARAEPPLGRALIADDYRRMAAPFGFADG
ncbi:helix-turn-helix domain-containing protein [Parvularcula oceani]|uniref:helix-turn-helix domain-containing protein n=1 Tax=Parvularcula oceani TaxID=1247963 RepID=UPI0004E2360B|nr:helix-turn-helix transcriptional regulator [Parvularcula oceani]